MNVFGLTFLSNVVAYACRPSSTKDRHDLHPRRLLDRRAAIGGRRRYGAHESLGNRALFDDGAKWRKLGGNWRKLVLGAHSGAKVFPGARIAPPAAICYRDPQMPSRADLSAIGKTLAGIAEIPATRPAKVSYPPSETSKSVIGRR